jgi:oxygen-independent coproporphyrinogen-3 oxidase
MHNEDYDHRSNWPYPALLPYSLKAYPIVQIAKQIGPQRASTWPMAMDPGVAEWRDATAHLPNAGNQIYIHVPFCPHLCHFCPLYKVKKKTDDKKRLFVEALIQEIDLYGSVPSVAGKHFNTVYIGGGTGTELTPEQTMRVFRALRRNFSLTADAEITMEGTARQMLGPEYLAKSLEYGMNRVSFGVESLDVTLRKRIGRGDKIADYVNVVELCRKLDPKIVVNAETMAALPEQTLESVEYDVAEMIRWGLDSADVFYYVMMPGTRLEKLVTSKQRAEPRYGATMLRMRDLVATLFRKAGYHAVTGEVFSRNDRDLFTKTSFGGGGNCLNTVLALGPSSFGNVNGTIYQNVCDLDLYIDQAGQRLFPVHTATRLDLGTAQRRARLLSLLRLEVPDAIFNRYGDRRRIERWRARGLLDPIESGHRLSARGLLWYNHMQMELLPLRYLIKAAGSMFGAVEHQKESDVALNVDTQAHEITEMFKSHGRVGLLAYKGFMAARRLPFMERRAVGFTGVVDS